MTSRPGRFAPRLRRLALAVAALAGASCGIEYIAYLDAPVAEAAVADYFSFRSPQYLGATGLVYFLGYEIYYKLYDASDDAASAQSSFSDLTTLRAAGFQRLTAQDDVSANPPLVRVPLDRRAQSHSVTVTFPPLGEQPYLVASWAPTTKLLLRRGVLYHPDDITSTQTFQAFTEFSVEDLRLPASQTDLTPAVWQSIQFGSPVKLALFVLTYGLDAGVPLHSVPTYLYNVDYTVVTQ